MTRFIDSHCHLADPQFADDSDQVIERAAAAGAAALVCIGASIADAERAKGIAARHPMVQWTAGIHPYDAGTFDAAADIPALRTLLDAGAVGIGECGLDYHYDTSPRAKQAEAFAAQLALAAERKLPVVVHTREAESDTSVAVEGAGRAGVTGVLHCYTGSVELARRALDAGWYISFSGIITFKSWTDLELLRLVPDDRVLVESDSPYLAPVPMRGKRNEPAWVAHTLERLAAARSTTVEHIAGRCTQNTEHFFGFRAPVAGT